MPDLPVLTAKDFKSDQDVRWCPGCGDYAILNQVQRVLAKIGSTKENTVFVAGIGCSSRFPYYMDTYGFHTIHGRAPGFATGVKLANPELDVWVVTGDGDGLSIGAGHLMHALRRNVGLKILLFNNRIYGLTKGQYSPTSEVGKRTPSTPMGSLDNPLNPIAVAIAAEASFVARGVDVDKELPDVLERAAGHTGSAFVEIYQDCNVFNHMAFGYATGKSLDAAAGEDKENHILRLQHGKPMVFGKPDERGRRRGIRLTGDHKPELVEVRADGKNGAEGGVSPDDLLFHDERDPALGYLLSQMRQPEFPEPVGVFHARPREPYERMVAAQVAAARESRGEGTLEQLFSMGETYTVEAGPDSRHGLHQS